MYHLGINVEIDIQIYRRTLIILPQLTIDSLILRFVGCLYSESGMLQYHTKLQAQNTWPTQMSNIPSNYIQDVSLF